MSSTTAQSSSHPAAEKHLRPVSLGLHFLQRPPRHRKLTVNEWVCFFCCLSVFVSLVFRPSQGPREGRGKPFPPLHGTVSRDPGLTCTAVRDGGDPLGGREGASLHRGPRSCLPFPLHGCRPGWDQRQHWNCPLRQHFCSPLIRWTRRPWLAQGVTLPLEGWCGLFLPCHGYMGCMSRLHVLPLTEVF